MALDERNNAGSNATRAENRREANQNRVYSFVETPIEMRSSTFRPEQALPPLPVLPTEHTNQSSPYPQEKESDNSTSPNNLPPPEGMHPAFAQNTQQTESTIPVRDEQVTLPSHPISPHTPHSPGPIPIKSDLEHHDPSTPSTVPDVNAHSFAAPPRAFSSYQPDNVPGAGTPLGQHTPGQISHPNQQIAGGTWTHGLCDCGDVPTCCTGIWCPCILYGKTQYRLSNKSSRKDPTNMLGYATCNGSCVSYTVLCGFQGILTMIQRTRIRKSYEIQGSYASDCIRSCCCGCCALVQDEREIKHREEHARRNAGPSTAAVVAPYASTPSMAYAPPPR